MRPSSQLCCAYYRKHLCQGSTRGLISLCAGAQCCYVPHACLPMMAECFWHRLLLMIHDAKVLSYLECCCHVLLHSLQVACCGDVCRLLHYNVQEAKRVVASPAPAITRFAEEQSPEQRDRIFDELNTLAVVYRQPSSSFTNAIPAFKEVCPTSCKHVCSCSVVCESPSILLAAYRFALQRNS